MTPLIRKNWCEHSVCLAVWFSPGQDNRAQVLSDMLSVLCVHSAYFIHDIDDVSKHMKFPASLEPDCSGLCMGFELYPFEEKTTHGTIIRANAREPRFVYLAVETLMRCCDHGQRIRAMIVGEFAPSLDRPEERLFRLVSNSAGLLKAAIGGHLWITEGRRATLALTVHSCLPPSERGSFDESLSALCERLRLTCGSLRHDLTIDVMDA